jgi:hypothetical protein
MPKVECYDCRLLPYAIDEVPVGLFTERRPANPRPIDPRSGPRKPRCFTHEQARLKRERERAATTRRERVHGMTPEQDAELRDEQGGLCPCGSRIKHLDHDHLIARTLCDHHPDKESCERCWRGYMCHNCNSYILGRGYNRRRLLALVAYLDDPPMARIRRRELERLEGA